MAVEFGPGHMGPHAQVRAEAEDHGLSGRAVDAELEGILEDGLVAVGRRPVQRHLVPGVDQLPVQLAVLGGRPREVGDRRDPSEYLLDGIGQELGVGPQLLPLVGKLTEGLHAPGDGVPGGLVAGLHQQLAVGDELLLGERHTVDLALHQLGDQVVLGILTTGGHHGPEVPVQLAASPHRGLFGALAGEPVLGIVLADDLVGPPEVVFPVGSGHPQDPGDHRHRIRGGEGVDEVALPDLAPGGGPLHHLGRDPLDLLAARPAPRCAGTSCWPPGASARAREDRGRRSSRPASRPRSDPCPT